MGALSDCYSGCGSGIPNLGIWSIFASLPRRGDPQTTSPAPTPVVPLFLLGNAGVVPTLATLGPCLCTGVVVGLFPGGWVGFLGSLVPPYRPLLLH